MNENERQGQGNISYCRRLPYYVGESWKWITPPETGDNRWEFQQIFYNPNINFKKVSEGRKFIIPEDFGFKPDSYLLSLKLTDICNKGEFETNKERLKKVYGPQ